MERVPVTLALVLAVLLPFRCGAQNELLHQYAVPVATGALSLSCGVAHLVAPASYSWQKHTISQLGAQHYNKAGLMNSGFVLHGTLLTLTSANDLMKGNGHWSVNSCMLLYGMSTGMLGMVHTVPFTENTPYSPRESHWHGILAVSAGTALTGAMLSSLITEKNKKKIPLHIAALSVAGLSSALIFTDERNKGIWERTLLLSGMCWMTLNYSFKF